MKILLVTEKSDPPGIQRDGGARLVETMKQEFANDLSIMQFGLKTNDSATWNFAYPFNMANRFERRIANAEFIATKVKAVEKNFSHIVFVHISMQFGITTIPLADNIKIWTLPMFLSASYIASGEDVPQAYKKIEHLTLADSKNILTPSYLEKKQLVDLHAIPKQRIHVIPRGINLNLIKPKVRSTRNTAINFCTIGSIKRQKNISGLIRLFERILLKWPDSSLLVIGPIQDKEYYNQVYGEINLKRLDKFISFTGHIAPEKISFALENCHIHLSTSLCETFGRSIFETLALGLPNIAKAQNNAAADFLENLPYVKFVNDDEQALNEIDGFIKNLPALSCMAKEIGKLFDDNFLSKLIRAKITNASTLCISDFDGTIFHKHNTGATLHCISVFNQFPMKVICSARSIEDLLPTLNTLDIKADWIISNSGAVVTNGKGKTLLVKPLDKRHIEYLEKVLPNFRPIIYDGLVIQISAPVESLPELLITDLRTEVYQDVAFISHWEASKLQTSCKLINLINWQGQVQVFGDGKYDKELLAYFDGQLITNSNYIDNFKIGVLQ